MSTASPPPSVVAAFALEGAAITRVPTGLIHQTFAVDAPGRGRFALQGLSGIFAPELEHDYAATTRHLAAKGLEAPTLVAAREGARTVVDDAGVRWRLITWIDGHTRERVDSPAVAYEAGRALGRLHAALADFDVPLRARRLGVHDTPRHLAALRAALERHPAHPHHADVAPLAAELFTRIEPLPDLSALPERFVHGDPKITNLLFGADGRARAWIDLDTIAPMKLPLELGDALRSWCNPSGEDGDAPRFDHALARAALDGHADGAQGLALGADERALLLPSARTIMLELSARFLADTLEDRYFGWDPSRFESRSAHNLHRGRVQLALARSFDDAAR
jgi:Ser/Thr protein kinase RdoA (MazF antagonist)